MEKEIEEEFCRIWQSVLKLEEALKHTQNVMKQMKRADELFKMWEAILDLQGIVYKMRGRE